MMRDEPPHTLVVLERPVFATDPSPTPLDLRFRLFRTAVTVQPWFWLGAFVFSPTDNRQDVIAIVLWIAIAFVSILLHEFGHVWMARAFGVRSEILMSFMGGLAIGQFNRCRRWQRVLISLAGPGIQLILWAVLVYGVLPFVPKEEVNRRLFEVLAFLIFVNWWWPLINMVPIWPLDGGQVMREFCTWVAPNRGVWISVLISFLLATLLALYALYAFVRPEGPFLPWVPRLHPISAAFFGLWAYASFLMMNQEAGRSSRWDDRLPWER